MDAIHQGLFVGQNYLSLETYRKNGEAVRTPVWFAQDGSTLYVWTVGTSGKAKRIRREGRVKVAPCDRVGNPLGEYVPGEAEIYAIGSPGYQHGDRLMDQKYGLMKKLFAFMGRKDNPRRVIVAIRLARD